MSKKKTKDTDNNGNGPAGGTAGGKKRTEGGQGRQDENNIKDRLEKIWDERKGLYDKSSHYCIETDNLNPKMVLGEILNILELPFENSDSKMWDILL